jgi:hypothetical protein
MSCEVLAELIRFRSHRRHSSMWEVGSVLNSYCHGHFIYVGLYIGLQRHVLFNCNYANTGGLICGGGAKMKIEKGPINHVVKMKFKVVGYIVAL